MTLGKLDHEMDYYSQAFTRKKTIYKNNEFVKKKNRSTIKARVKNCVLLVQQTLNC